MSKTYYLTSQRRQEVLTHVMAEGDSEVIIFDLTPWEEDNGTVTAANWTVNSGDATTTNLTLTNSVASGLVTTTSEGTSRINISFTDGINTAIRLLDVKALESGATITSLPTTPETLTTDIDLNYNGFTLDMIAAEALVNGQMCYLNTSGKMAPADADADTTSTSMLGMCTETLAANETGVFVVIGVYTSTTALTPGSVYYLSQTAGEITTTPPTGTGVVQNQVGHAVSATQLFITPDPTWIKLL